MSNYEMFLNFHVLSQTFLLSNSMQTIQLIEYFLTLIYLGSIMHFSKCEDEYILFLIEDVFCVNGRYSTQNNMICKHFDFLEIGLLYITENEF